MYNWDDSTQPNDGYADHIGIVEKVSGGQITCIEGNINGGMVARRTIPVGYGYIRGYARPKYAAAPTTDPSTPTTDPSTNFLPGTTKVELQTFLIGAVHPQVRTIQRILNALGYKGKDGKALEVDGSLGPNTAYAIEAFQKAKGLQGINFGTVAAKTWSLLLSA